MKTTITILLAMFTLQCEAQGNHDPLPLTEQQDIIKNPGGLIQWGHNAYFLDRNLIRLIPLPQMHTGNTPGFKNNPSSYTLTRAEIMQMPVTDLRDLLPLFPGISQVRRGDDINVYGSRVNGMQYIVDGMR